MAAAYESISTTAFGGDDSSPESVVITKPTGLALGDLMLAGVFHNNGTSWDVPAGWTSIASLVGVSEGYSLRVFAKLATSDDVAATNFTFTIQSGGANIKQGGSILRFSGASLPTIYDADADVSGTATPSYTGGITPTSANSILVMFIAGLSTGVRTVSNYAIATNNPTWTERADINIDVTSDPFFAVATGPRAETTSTGAYSATLSGTVAASMGVLVAVQALTGPANIKTINGTALASCKTVDGTAITAIKNISGLT